METANHPRLKEEHLIARVNEVYRKTRRLVLVRGITEWCLIIALAAVGVLNVRSTRATRQYTNQVIEQNERLKDLIQRYDQALNLANDNRRRIETRQK